MEQKLEQFMLSSNIEIVDISALLILPNENMLICYQIPEQNISMQMEKSHPKEKGWTLNDIIAMKS